MEHHGTVLQSSSCRLSSCILPKHVVGLCNRRSGEQVSSESLSAASAWMHHRYNLTCHHLSSLVITCQPATFDCSCFLTSWIKLDIKLSLWVSGLIYPQWSSQTSVHVKTVQNPNMLKPPTSPNDFQFQSQVTLWLTVGHVCA